MRIRPSCFLVLAGLSGAASAQTSTPIDRNRVDRRPPASTELQRDEQPAPAAATRVDAGDEAAPPIRNISFEGTDVPESVARAAGAFVGQPASKANLQALADAMSEAYGRSEVALFTIAIPEQDLSSGNVRIMVAEGHIEAVILAGEVEGRPLGLVQRYAARLTKERPTSRRTMERYLSLIQDIPGLKVKPELQMGTGSGGVRLILNLDYQRPTVSFSFDNRTTRLVEDGQVSATARAYRLLREGDETQLNLISSIDASDLLYFGLSHSTPIGSDGMRLSLNAGFLRTRPDGTDQAGEARSLGMTLSYPFIRSYRRNMTLSLGLDGLNSENAAFGSVISTERSRALRAAAAYAEAGKHRTLNGSVSASTSRLTSTDENRGHSACKARTTAASASARGWPSSARACPSPSARRTSSKSTGALRSTRRSASGPRCVSAPAGNGRAMPFRRSSATRSGAPRSAALSRWA